jgi:hypothetical protein
MALTDMKRKPKKNIKTEEMAVPVSEDEGYPWGLRVTLREEDLQKLGVSAKEFTLQEAISLTAEAKVTLIQKDVGSDYTEVTLQITKLSLGKGQKASKYSQYDKQRKAGPGE